MTNQSNPTGPVVLVQPQQADTPVERLEAFIAHEPWLEPQAVVKQAKRIYIQNAGLQVRYGQFVRLADRINQAVMPFAACHKGCDYCCSSMVTAIYRFEAIKLSEVTGRKMTEVPYQPRELVIAEHNQRSVHPCPFLAEGTCSVYEHRPLVCRLHHSLSPRAEDCRPLSPTLPAATCMYDADLVEEPYHLLVHTLRPKEPWAPIASFFPD